jgi:hypothetical protein
VSFARFSGFVAVVLLATSVVCLRGLGAENAQAAILGAGLAAINAAAAYALVLYSQGRSTQVFVRAVLGGMGLRLGAMLIVVFVGVRTLGAAQTPFVLSLLLHFMIFLALEVLAAHRRSVPAEASR